MRLRPILLLVCVTVLAASLSTAGLRGEPAQFAAQAPKVQASQEPPQQPIRVSVDLVNLFVTVRDNKKRIVPGLELADFRVLEDGV